MGSSPMNEEFTKFLNERIREKGFSLNKLSEATGITPEYLSALVEGDYSRMPAAPYMRGYLKKLADVLEFDANEWQDKFRRMRAVSAAGAGDVLPSNRFSVRGKRIFILPAIAAALLVLYGGLRFYQIIGRPKLTVLDPSTATVSVASDEFVIRAAAAGVDRVTINGEDAFAAEDGVYEKKVILSPGLNTFTISAKKFLGAEAHSLRQIFYESRQAAQANSAIKQLGTASSSISTSTSTSSSATSSATSSKGD